MSDGQELKALRERHGWSRAQLAELLGVSERQAGRLERGERRLRADEDAKLGEWRDAESTPYSQVAAGRSEAGEAAAVADELPRPPYDPAHGPDPDEEPEQPEKPKRKRAPAGKTVLRGWQAEAQQFLATLIRGQAIQVETEPPQQLVIPGLAHGIQAFWCPRCALIVATAADAFAAAFVKAYPQLARRMLVPGPQAELVLVLVTQVALPCVTHHVQLGHPAAHADANGGPPAAETGVETAA